MKSCSFVAPLTRVYLTCYLKYWRRWFSGVFHMILGRKVCWYTKKRKKKSVIFFIQMTRVLTCRHRTRAVPFRAQKISARAWKLWIFSHNRNRTTKFFNCELKTFLYEFCCQKSQAWKANPNSKVCLVSWFKGENVPSSTVFEKKTSKKKDDGDF